MEKQVRAQLAREAYRRLIRLLEIYFEGPVLIMSEQVDEAYIRLPRFFRGAVNAKGFEKLQRAFPKELPESLHSVKFEDAATEWEHTIRPAMDVFMGKLLQFCVEVGRGPWAIWDRTVFGVRACETKEGFGNLDTYPVA